MIIRRLFHSTAAAARMSSPVHGGWRRGAILRRYSADSLLGLRQLLEDVRDGRVELDDALTRLQRSPTNESSQTTLDAFANLDHDRSKRTGFPEAVFAQGKTSDQVASILDDMARRANELVLSSSSSTPSNDLNISRDASAILATRVSPEMHNDLQQYQFAHGSIEYHGMARIVSMTPSAFSVRLPMSHSTAIVRDNERKDAPPPPSPRIVVATAGTTDIPVAEEAAVTLQAARIDVDRVYDVGVAGLHRIIQALPRLTHPNVRAVIVCAGMDGALPSVVGGLVKVPVIAVPCSIGYGASLGGVSALLTMLNSCSPGVGVVNIDNGFGAAALAFKCLASTSSRQ